MYNIILYGIKFATICILSYIIKYVIELLEFQYSTIADEY